MAAIARRTWSELKNELTQRMGRWYDSSFTAGNGDSERLIEAAYFYICSTWHFAELDEIDTALTLTPDQPYISISSIYPSIIVGVELQTAAGAFKWMLVHSHSRALFNSFRSTSGEPREYSQFGDSIYFERPPDAAYKLRVFYYDTEPTAPDFSTGSPATPRTWDEMILEYAHFLGERKVGRHDLAGQLEQAFAAKAALMPQPLLSETLQRPEPAKSTINQSLMGAQG